VSLSALRKAVFERDQYACRMPWCSVGHYGASVGLELAHLKARGMGGNPDGSRNVTSNCICCCRSHHQGPRSLHSGHIKWEALTDQGADGPMAFTYYEKLPTAELGLHR